MGWMTGSGGGGEKGSMPKPSGKGIKMQTEGEGMLGGGTYKQ